MSDNYFSRNTFFRQIFDSQPSLSSRIFSRSYARSYCPYSSSTYGSALSATWLIIDLNTAVFAAWEYAQARDHRLLRQLQDNFTLSWSNWQAGRTWILLTSAFSHIEWWHFGFNMLACRSFGMLLSWIGIGASHVLALSLGGGIVGSATWLYQKQRNAPTIMGGRLIATPQAGSGVREVALGASGMVMGVGAVAACLAPFAAVNIMLVPVPVPLWVATAAYAAVDTYFMHSETSPIGHAAHLGGALWGVAYYLAFLRGYGGISKWLIMRRR